MNSQLSIIKGLHPGFFIERELKRKNLKKSRFAISINEFPQTLVSITKGKRKMNTSLALRIEKALNLEEGYLMILQVYYDIELEKKIRNKSHSKPFPKLRKILFWDTTIENLDWDKQKNAIIKRVYERGNEDEKQEIMQFYGIELIEYILKGI